MGEEMTLLIRGDVSLLRGNFLVGKMSKCLAIGWDYPPIPRVSHKGSGERGQSTPGGAKKQTKGEDIFGQNGDTGV